MPQVDPDARPSGRAAGYERPTGLKAFHAFIPGSRTHVLDHDVDAFFAGNLANLFCDLLLVVIDTVICAESPSLFELGLISCGGNNTAMKHLCNLNRGDADTRTCTEHKHRLPGTHSRQTNQHVPGCDEYQWHARGLIEVERVGNRNDICAGHRE